MASRDTTLENAPEADEPETPEEADAVTKAWREHREGKSITTEELGGAAVAPDGIMCITRALSTSGCMATRNRAKRTR